MDMEKEYDGLNHRIVRGSRLEGTKTNYLFGRNGAVVSEKCAKNGGYALRDFYYLNDQVILFKDYVENSFERLCYPVTDIQGSVYEIYSSEGKLLWKMNYGSYGDADGAITDLIGDFSRNQSEALSFNGMYTGSQRDRETSLTYHWNRWQSEDGLTWLTQDPTRDGSNWFGYAGQNPVMYTDLTGLTTLDDFIYQQRTEAKNSEEYVNTFKEEVNAEVRNQGMSDIPDNRYNSDGSAKNSVYQENLAKTNYFVHVYEVEQSKIVTKTYKQKQIERKYGYGNFLCLVTSILNAYVSDGVVTNRFMDTQLGNIIRNNLKIDGYLYNMTQFSRQIASTLGLDGYYDYAYINGNRIAMSESAFRLSEYNYGIGRFSSYSNYLGNIFKSMFLNNDLLNNVNKNIIVNTEHFGLYRNSPYNDYCNPGSSDGIGNYVLQEINPLSYISF